MLINFFLLSFFTFTIIYTIILFLLITACFTKSAIIPYIGWLLNAMMAPTPVSALLHSSTMVMSGVWLSKWIFNLSIPELLYYYFLISIGLTLIYACFKAINSIDIKIIIAYTTVVQICYLFFAIIISTELMLLHLFYHAFLKALLFLIAGAIIHLNNNEQNIYKLKISD